MSKLDPQSRNKALGNLDICAAENFFVERPIDYRSAVAEETHLQSSLSMDTVTFRHMLFFVRNKIIRIFCQ